MKIIIILIIIIIIVSLKFYKEKTIKENFTLDSGEAMYNANKSKIKFVNNNSSRILPPFDKIKTYNIKINASPKFRETKKLNNNSKSKSNVLKKSEKDKTKRSISNKNKKIRNIEISNIPINKISKRNNLIDYKIEAIDNRNKMITKTLKTNIEISNIPINKIFKRNNLIDNKIEAIDNRNKMIRKNLKPNIKNLDNGHKNKMLSKSLKNLDEQKKTLSYSKRYYKKPLDPNERLEKTLRPNKYEFINKDNVEPKIRDTSENKSFYTHIKPGKNIFHAYGYSYIPPEVWSVPQERPPVCIPQKGFKADAVPLYTTGTPLNALEIQQTLMPKFKYEEVYDPKYYYPGWITK